MSLEENIRKFHNDLIDCRDTGKSVELLYDTWASKYEELHPTGKYINTHAATTLSKYFENKKDVKVVDIACGTGMTSKYLQEYGFQYIHGFDLSQQMVNQAKETGYFQRVSTGRIGDSECLDCEDNEFDAVVCISGISINHIRIKNALREFLRILKQGGIAVFSVSDTCHITELFDALKNYLLENKFDFVSMEKRFHFENVEKKTNEQCYFCVLKKM